MNQEVKEKWIEALRSGDYLQGMGRLRTTTKAWTFEPLNTPKFCCLGVLCDLYDSEGWADNIYFFDPREEMNGLLPKSISEWSGVSAEVAGELSRLNDLAQLSFDDIAKYIEEKL